MALHLPELTLQALRPVLTRQNSHFGLRGDSFYPDCTILGGVGVVCVGQDHHWIGGWTDRWTECPAVCQACAEGPRGQGLRFGLLRNITMNRQGSCLQDLSELQQSHFLGQRVQRPTWTPWLGG